MSEELKPSRCPVCCGKGWYVVLGEHNRIERQKCKYCQHVDETSTGHTPDHTDLVRQLVEALADTLDDSRECLVEDESRWGGFRKDRIKYRKDQIAKYEALITAAKEAGF